MAGPVASPGKTALAREVLHHQVFHRLTPREMRAYVPVQGKKVIVFLQSVRAADGRRLVPVSGIRPADDLSLVVEAHDSVLEFPRQDHATVERQELLFPQASVRGCGCVGRRALRGPAACAGAAGRDGFFPPGGYGRHAQNDARFSSAETMSAVWGSIAFSS